MKRKVKEHKYRNIAQKELIENYGGKSVPHSSKKDYKRRDKHKKPWEQIYND